MQTIADHLTAIIAGTLSGFTFSALFIYLFQYKRKLYKLRSLFPNSPFKIHQDFDGDYYFDLKAGNLEFDLIKGTKPNGIYGVIGIEIKSSPKFVDGTNMMQLMNDLNKLSMYIKSLNLNLKDSWDFIKTVQKEVAAVNTLDYLETKESQK